MRSHNSLLLEVRSLLATALDTMEACVKLLHVLCPIEILLFAESNVAEEEQAALVATRILHALVKHVSEVQALAKHEAMGRCLGWCNAHTL